MTANPKRRASPPTPEAIEACDLFVIKGLSIRAVAEAMRGRKGCSQRQLERRMANERWMEKRRAYVEKETAKTHEAAAQTAAGIRARQLGEYEQVGQMARIGLLKVAQRISQATVVSPDDADVFRKLAGALDVAQKGQRAVADTSDDRVTALMEAAARLGEGRIDDIEDWDPEEELQQAMTPKHMDDLSFSQEKPPTGAPDMSNGKPAK